MTTAVQHRRGTTAEHSTFTGLEGEVTIDTTKDTAVIHDGVLAGGYPLAKETLANVNPSSLTAITGAATASDDLFMVYDASTTSMKKITRAELNNAMEADALSNVSITGGTINGTTIGGTTAAAGSFTTLSASDAVTLSAGTANGVAYLNGSKVLTSGSALTFDGTSLGLSAGAGNFRVGAAGDTSTHYFRVVDNGGQGFYFGIDNAAGSFFGAGAYGRSIYSEGNYPIQFVVNSAEQMRLTSTGLGIGTSSPGYKLDVVDTGGNLFRFTRNTEQIGSYVSAGNVYFGTLSNNPLLLMTNSTTKATLDSSGNLGLGVTPSAWSTAYRVMDFTGGGAVGYMAGGNNVNLSSNMYRDASFNYIYKASDFATQYAQDSGQHCWFTAPSGTAGNAISFTQAMTLTEAGNLALARTSVEFLSANRGNLTIGGSASSLLFLGVGSTAGTYLLHDQSNASAELWNTANGYIRFGTNNTERARITSSGDLLVGTTDGSTGNKLVTTDSIGFIAGSSIPQINYYSSAATIEYVNRNSSGSKTFSWYYQASGAGSPATLSTSGVWTNASDARGKENISDIHYGLDTVMALQPRQYDVKSDSSHAIGFIAQEVLPVVPELVHVTRRTENDEFYGLDYGSMTAVLVKAIQEQQAIIEDLKSRLTAAGL